MSVALATAEQVSITYGRRAVVARLDLTIESGNTALLGPNGAGKTTLLKAITGLRRPRSGRLDVLGVDMSSPGASRRIARQIGFLPQTDGAVDHFSVSEYVRYAGWLKEIPRDDLQRRSDDAIDKVGLTGRRHSKVRHLSGGMRKRVNIAAALVHQPRFVILDEPTVGLDPEQRADLRDLLIALSSTTSFLLSTHLLEDVGAICEHVAVLDEGRLRFRGTLHQMESMGEGKLEDGYRAALKRGRRS